MGKVELFCLFVACSYTSRKVTELSCHFNWVGSSMPKILWNNKSLISLESIDWFCRFFAYILLDILWSYENLLFQAGIYRHRLSDNQIVRCFKLEKLENYMRYQGDFLLTFIEATESVMLFWVMPQNTLG